MNQPPSDAPLISWRCYEPAGHRVELSESDLVQHILLIGSTGSGKSTLLTSATGQIIGHHAGSPEHKPGLLVLDAKGDDLVARVQDAAQAFGRANDVLVFGPNADHGFDLFEGLRSFDDVDRITRRVLLGTERMGGDNAYWWHSTTAMFSAAFTLLVATEQPVQFAATVEFLRRWFLSPATPPVVLERVQMVNREGGNRHPLLATALDQVRLWQELDSRTRSNLQSCLLNALRPLLSPAAARCFGPRSPAVFTPALAASDGRICVVSVNALAEPDLARFLFRLAKQSFFDAVQQRRSPQDRLCGLIADEFPLVVAPEDVEQLATVRSKRCFVIAATQGLHALIERVGVGPARSLANHFNTTIYLRTREAETAVQAHLALGTRQVRVHRRGRDEGRFLGLMVPPSQEPAMTEVPVCPLGALGQLSPHQAYLVFADGRRTEFPVWFIPWFEAVARPVGGPAPQEISKFNAEHVRQLMQRAGFRLRWSPEVVMPAAAICRRRRRKTLIHVVAFFLTKCCLVPEGLETLPDCWLSALPGILWSTRRKHWTKVPYFIKRVSVADGLLLLEFAQELPEPGDRITSWDRLRIRVNAGVYPSRWRPLSPWHEVKLRQLHPELRLALDIPGQDLA